MSKITKTIQSKFVAMRQDMADCLVEREPEIDLVLTAMLCRENVVLVSVPGLAKSFLLDLMMGWVKTDLPKFTCLYNKFTTPEEVYGPLSVAALKKDEFRRNTTRKLPEAVFAFGDEIFKASTAILNTMLRVLNERQFDNGSDGLKQCPLRLFVAASNEWPSDQDGGGELGALFDRFLFRKEMQRVSVAGRDRLLWGDHTPNITTSITLEEIDKAAEEVQTIQFTETAKQTYRDILDELNKEGIFPGDRRMIKSIKACQAYAYLNGSKEVRPEHLEVLAHTLWDDPTEQPAKTARIVVKLANPELAKVNELLSQVTDVIARNSPTDAVPKLQAIQKEFQAMSSDRALQARQHISQELKRLYNLVIGVEA